MVRGVVLPYVRGGVIAAITLGLGRALGEAIAVTQVIGGTLGFHWSLFAPGDTMAGRIAAQYQGSATALQTASLAYLAVILLVISLATNLSAQLITRRIQSRIEGVVWKADTAHFGEVRLKLADVRSLRSLAADPEGDFGPPLPDPGSMKRTNLFGNLVGGADGCIPLGRRPHVHCVADAERSRCRIESALVAVIYAREHEMCRAEAIEVAARLLHRCLDRHEPFGEHLR